MYEAFGVRYRPSRVFFNQLLRFCPGSHLQCLFQVEMLRGVFSRLLHSDHEWGQKKRVPIRRSCNAPNFGRGLHMLIEVS